MLKPQSFVANIVVLLIFISTGSLIKNTVAQPVQLHQDSPRYLAHVEANTFDELQKLLLKAAKLFESGKFQVGVDHPVAFVLHGPEAKALLQKNYRQNKDILDLAARLTAFGVVDIKVCRTWMGTEAIKEEQLPPFVGTVPLGLAEHKRLREEERYVYF